jgi:ABC-type multidrug transport system fused ATPase/permease subunit
MASPKSATSVSGVKLHDVPDKSSSEEDFVMDRDEAMKAADVARQLENERQQLLASATFCSIICPRRNKGAAPTEATAKEDGKEGEGGEKPKEKEPEKKVPFCGSRGVLRFADSVDVTLYLISCVGSAAHGAIQPLFALVFGFLIDALNDGNPDALSRRIDEIALWFVYIGIGSLVLGVLEVGLSTIAAERQIGRIRELYVKSLLRQEMAYFDFEDPGEVASRLTEDTIVLVDGIGEKLGNAVHNCSAFIVGLAVGFARGWDLALVILAFVPLLALPMVALKSAHEVLSKINADAYARAGSAASEAIANIRTVFAFNGQQAETRRYASHLELAELITLRGGRAVGFAVGMFWLSIMSAYAAGMGYGASRIRQSRLDNPICQYAIVADGVFSECYTAGTLMQTFFAVLIGAMSIGQAAPNFSAFGAAQAAAYKIFSVIDRESKIDPSEKVDKSSGTEARCSGTIEFKNVTFAYPADKTKTVLEDFSITIKPGETLALVGESGSGKSTIVQLLMRFYDPDSGSVLLDGKDLREYDVGWLRRQMGIVSQEPSLFATSLEENIALGLPHYESNFGEMTHDGGDAVKAVSGVELSHGHTEDGLPLLDDETREAVIEAAKAASVHEFASALPKGYRTRVGERGGQLSGGQKQRVAIARAIVRKPQIFIGDEATSALDSESEKQVKKAMDRLMKGAGRALTSILIAHRLSTVTNATKIVVLARGVVRETGTHEELMLKRGIYFALAAGQGLADGVEHDTIAADVIPSSPALRARSSSEGSVAHQRSRASSVESDGSHAAADVLADKQDDIGFILARVEEHMRAGLRSPIDRLFFAILNSATCEDAEESATPLPPAEGQAQRISRAEPRLVLLQSSFLEMALNEKRAFLCWWTGATTEQVTEWEKGIAASDDGLKTALDALKDPVPTIAMESKEMVRKARSDKVAIWDAAPVAVAKQRVLHLPPIRSRNKMLQLLLSTSRPAVPMGKVFARQRPERAIMGLALLVSGINGTIFPIYALILSDMLTVLYKTGDEFEAGVLGYCLGFFGLGIGAALAAWAQTALYEYLSAKLTRRLREETYAKLLEQEIGFFDYEFNTSGQLTGRLSGDAALVRQTTGEKVGVVISNVSSLLSGIIIAFTASWQLSLIVLAIVPLFILSGTIRMKVFKGFASASKEALEQSAQIATEAFVGIRTVTAMGLQRHMTRSFTRSLEGPRRNAVFAGLTGGFALGLSQMILFTAGYALVFWAGSRFIAQGLIGFNDVTRVFFALTFAATGMGNAQALAGDQAKAESAKRSIFAIIDRIPKMKPVSGVVTVVAPRSEEPSTPESASKSSILGRIEFKNVSFSYPARPDSKALKNVSLVFEAGDTIGLVGPSGSGKSTIVQLLMRFYDPDGGSILLDGKDLREYDLADLRDRMGLVSQEPVLFGDTIHYNIAYGLPGGLDKKPLPDLGLKTEHHESVVRCRAAVVEAATAASAHDFITTKLPLGYSTFTGAQGLSRLSGGQKQRVAIARSLIRKPRIFLGDEATSALDTKSEAEVQKAFDAMLEEARRKSLNRTSLFVAHRLSTIRDADKVVVLEDGEVKEQGSHSELLKADGLYAKLAKAQQLTDEHDTARSAFSAATSAAAPRGDDATAASGAEKAAGGE